MHLYLAILCIIPHVWEVVKWKIEKKDFGGAAPKPLQGTRPLIRSKKPRKERAVLGMDNARMRISALYKWILRFLKNP